MGGPFDGALVAQVARGARGNYICSPASVMLALAMAREGATGGAAAELDALLGPDARARATTLIAALHNDQSPLVVANRLFAALAYPFVPQFLATTEQAYGARAESLDFAADPDAARLHINAWVAEVTRDRIRDLLGPRTIDRLTRLVLVNAIYMKAKWTKPFREERTAPAPFHVAGGATIQAPAMRNEVHTRSGAYAGARLIELPYMTYPTRLAMLIAVPDPAPLAAVEAAYHAQGFAPFAAAMTVAGGFKLSLPKWECGGTAALGPALRELGLDRAMQLTDDFSGISAVESFGISDVVHQAWIKVDEEGTEAAAATAMMLAGAGMPPPAKQVFDVDRSFLYVIHDYNGAVLFAGRVIDPTLVG